MASKASMLENMVNNQGLLPTTMVELLVMGVVQKMSVGKRWTAMDWKWPRGDYGSWMGDGKLWFNITIGYSEQVKIVN